MDHMSSLDHIQTWNAEICLPRLLYDYIIYMIFTLLYINVRSPGFHFELISCNSSCTINLLTISGGIQIYIHIIYPYCSLISPSPSPAFIVKFSWSFFPPRPDGRIEVELVLEGVPGEGGAEIE